MTFWWRFIVTHLPSPIFLRIPDLNQETDSAEVREKLEVTLPDIKKQLEGEAERLKKLSEENEALRNHLAGLAEKAQLRCS